MDSYSQIDNLQDDTNIIPITTMSSDNSSVPLFEASLTADTPDPLYVRGYSGTGKTTFIRTLLYKIGKYNKDKEYITIYFNLQESQGKISIFKIDWVNKKFEDRNIFKLYSLLLSQINTIMNMNKKENQQEYIKRLTTVYNNYKICFDNRFPDECIDKIFNVIYKFISGDIPHVNKTNRYGDSFCTQMHERIVDLIKFNENEIKSTIDNLVLIIGIFLYCSPIEKVKYFFLYDNIEHYIGTNVLFDNDIPIIINMIRDSHKYMDGFFKDNDINYSHYFKLIFAVRDTSKNMIRYSTEQYADFLPDRYINVSSFYNISDIINRKIDYFLKNNSNNPKLEISEISNNIIIPMHDIIKLVNEISSDYFIMNLYNHNKRRTVMYLVEAMNMGKNKYIINRYNYIMEKVRKTEEGNKNILSLKDKIRNTNKEIKDNDEKIVSMKKKIAEIENELEIKDEDTLKAYKNGARNIIRRILYDLIQTKNIEKNQHGYFDRIKAVTDDHLGFGYARRILTYLYNKAVEMHSDEYYIGFFTLIKEVFEYPFRPEKIPDHLIKNVSEIIYVLADGDLERTHWCQLIVLKFQETYASVESIKRQFEKQYNNDKEDDKNYGIKITSAGQAFVSFSPSFEYYSCRYCPGKPPLYTITDKSQIISLLETVRTKAMQCIETVIDNAADLLISNNYINYEAQFSTDDNPKNILYKTIGYPREERTHVVQIISSHIGYLNNYRLFLINEKLFDEEIMIHLLNIIKEYINKLDLTSRVRSTNNYNGITSYYLGKKYLNKYNIVITKYKEQINKAFEDIFNKNLLINGK
jgi:hypothetical protein